ncbi:MAG: type II toxin-antitoxin system RelE/ParE family toxin [Clostridia bacterium]|nr:type II toxin-antitoxin system RelE/ParE family toxin [Clostridia bacterium]
MERYKIQLSIKAKNDYKRIVNYLKNELLEPSIANRYAELINSEIQNLECFPQKYNIIDDDIIKKLEYRKLIIKNYIAFYRINEKEKIVEIHRILYGASNWMKELQ